jgi:leucyl aminopeptidase
LEINVKTGDILESKSDAIIFGYYEGTAIESDIERIDKILNGSISQLIVSGEIKSKLRAITLLHSLGKLSTPRIAIVGLGKKDELTLDKIRNAVAEVCKLLRQKGAVNIESVVLGNGVPGISATGAAQAITEGALLGTYTYRKHITKEADYKDIKQFSIITPDSDSLAPLEQGCNRGKIIAEATNYARDLVNEPSNFKNPAFMAEKAMDLARQYRLEATILELDDIKKLGMGGLLGVSQGSIQSPRFIVLKYKGRPSTDVDIALVGKGITFDSGGISIKPSEKMGDMKGDMAGAASVMAALSAIARLKLKINATAIVPATENLPSGSAMRPGDIITIMNGKTVEIITTDAEGRLILADALSYAVKLGAKKIIDVATLTGSCQVALGDVNTGAFGNNQELLDQVIKAGAEAGEYMWQLPMNEEYKEQNRSDVADIKNTGGRYAGATTAALFLGEFVGDTPWVHLDVAGTSDTNLFGKESGYRVKGATGTPVRTLINLTSSLAEDG